MEARHLNLPPQLLWRWRSVRLGGEA